MFHSTGIVEMLTSQFLMRDDDDRNLLHYLA